MFTPRPAGPGGTFLTAPGPSGTAASYGRWPNAHGSQLQASSVHVSETANHVVELFSSVLPVLVSEAVIKAEPGTDISARISGCGWAWLVCGRKLCVWQYKPGSPNSKCRVLMLPPSDLAHRADLVCVLLRGGELAPAALAVAPAGTVRYWPNICREASSIDAVADLQGEECCYLANTQPLGCILGTTTSSLMLVTPSTIEGQTTLLIKPLKAPQGLITSIGQRVSSFIFGAIPAQSEARYLIKVLVEPTNEEGKKFVYVLLRNSLQKWFLEDQGPKKLCGECDLDRSMKEHFHNAVWAFETTLPIHLKAWCIDMQLSSNGVAVLMAALNPQVSQQLYYAIGTVDVRNVGSPAVSPGFMDFTVLRFWEQYTEEDEEAVLSYKFVLPSANCPSSFVYSGTKVYCVTSGSNEDDPDVIEFKEDKLLGAGSYEGTPLFFSQVNGIVCINAIHAPADDASLAVENMLQGSYLPTDDERIEGTSFDENNFIKLRSAFTLFCKNELVKSEEIVENIFPGRVGLFTDIDSALDTCVSQLSYWVVDNVPAVDPRWMQQQQSPGGSATLGSASLIIYHQLKDKLEIHRMLLNFLKSVGLWPRLYAVTVRESPMATNLLLQQQAEKLVAAMQLRSLQSQFPTIIDAGIRRVIKARGVSTPEGLSAADLFYQKVSEVDEFFPALAEEEDIQLTTGLPPRDEFALITGVNSIFLSVLREACLFRENEQLAYESAREIPLEFQPWTSILRDVIFMQHTLTITNAIPLAENATSCERLFQQLTDLADLVLSGYKVQLDSLMHDQAAYKTLELHYQQDKKLLIAPLIKATQYERAAMLAEKFYDFASLVEICELTKNKEKLESYMAQFGDQGFPEFYFKRLLDSGRRAELLDQPASQDANLERFLQDHPSLSWLHDIHLGKMGKAATTLHSLGQREERNMLRKKYLLSHSKLAALASDDPPETYAEMIKNINREQAVIMYQESLPAEVKEAYGLDPKSMRVLGPEELIEMYISRANVNANENDFTKALELLDFIEDTTRAQEVRMHIWCAAILRNQWGETIVDNPMDVLKDRLFFQVAQQGLVQGRNLAEYLPPLEDLLEMPDLQDLRRNPNFIFILGAGYEHLLRTAAVETSSHQA